MSNKKIAIVTGAGHRLGRYIALSLAQKGYSILVHYYSSEIKAFETMELLKSMGTQAFACQANLSDPAEILSMWEYVDSLPYMLEVLINSAAVMNRANILAVKTSEFDETISVNLRAPLICSQEAAKRMKEGGAIINISDIGAGKTWMNFPVYSISKSALEVLTKLMAKALAPEIRVNAIAPGLVFPPDNGVLDAWEKMVDRLPIKRPAAIGEITSMINYILDNKYITGQIYEIDGGYSLL
jgi:NAD(P)-dependent dehydrogenase (short-subunit alcohol dehydrogenase family)